MIRVLQSTIERLLYVVLLLVFIGQVVLFTITVRISNQLVEGVQETDRQGVINQKYIRCIILLPASTYTGTPEQRTVAIDNCAVQSRLPDGTRVKEAK